MRRRRRLRARPRLGLWLVVVLAVAVVVGLFERHVAAPGPRTAAVAAGHAATVPARISPAPSPTRLVAVGDAPALPVPLEGLAVASADGRLWAVGGLVGGNTSTTDIFSWRPGTAAWQRAASLPVPRHDGAAAAVAGQVWFFGGGLGTVSDAQSYAIVPGAGGGASVRALAPLPAVRSDLSAVGGSRAYVVGGYDGSVDALDVLSLRPGGNWRAVAHLPQGARYAAVARLGNELYVFGGLVPSGLTDAIWAVNLDTGRVRPGGRLPAAAEYMAAAVVDGRIFLLGGENQTGDLATIWRYDPANGRMSAAGSLPSGRGYGGVAVLGGKVYYVGGDRGGQALTQVVALVPGP